jgi:apolipoprotein N-acyltransferase
MDCSFMTSVLPTLTAAARIACVRPALSRSVPLAALAGAANVFAFAPFGWWPVQILSMAWLFQRLGAERNPGRNALVGLAFGFGWALAGVHWLYIALNRYAGMPVPLAALAVCFLAGYMALFAATATGAATRLRRRWSLSRPAFLLFALPACWGLAEWTRGWLFGGFPWLASGYAHSAGILGAYAPLVGVYGIGLLAALGAGCVALLPTTSRKPGLWMLSALVAGGLLLGTVEWTRPHGQPVSVRLLQGNVEQQAKFDATQEKSALHWYRATILAAPADLIAVPETALVRTPEQLPPGYLRSLQDYASRTGSHVVLGLPLPNGEGGVTNSVAGVFPGAEDYRFDKRHLVPFGEFIPPGFGWLGRRLQVPLGGLTAGPAVQPAFRLRDQLVLPNICYEDTFGEEIVLQLRAAPEPPTILLNASNLAWFGESIAIGQHLQMSQLRAMETGRPMLRSTNSGATAVIDGRGRIVAALPGHTPGVLSATVQGMRGDTPYIRLGNVLFLALAALGLLAALLSARADS